MELSHANTYPMPEVRSKLGTAAEKLRLAEAEETLRQMQYQNALLRKQLEEAEARKDDEVVPLKVAPQAKKESKAQPKVAYPKVGFEHHESWWQWIRRVIFRS